MKSALISILFIMLSLACFSQKTVTWNDLAQVTFEEKYLEEFEMNFLSPIFDSSIIELDSQIINVTGYFINLDPAEEVFILSREPMATCFHCGGAGPESAIELKFAPGARVYFKTDDIITITGRFAINAEDLNHMNYILSEARGRFAQR